MRAMLHFLAMTLVLCGAAHAGQPAAPVAFNIDPQSMAAALNQFAHQSGIQLLFQTEVARDRVAPRVVGKFVPEQALQQLLANTGLAYRFINAHTITIHEQRPTASAEARILQLASTDVLAEQTKAEPPAERKGGGEEVVVTGTSIRGATPTGSNLRLIERKEIEESGRSTVYEVLRTLPQNYPGSQNESTQLNAADNNLSFGAAIDLRGLGSDATLTLLNGRRLAPAGFGNFVDVSAIPLAAVERIEVLADGASATYGSDAVGGVVNIITRTDFSGLETGLRYGVMDGGAAETGVSQLFGRSWGSGHAMAGFEYRSRDALATSERPYTADSDLRSLGGDNFSRTQSYPGNITRIGTTPVSYAIPRGQNGTGLSQAALVAGTSNLQNMNLDSDTLPSQESQSLFVSARQALSPAIDIFLDAIATDRGATGRDAALGSNLTVPQTNAWRVANGLFPGQGNMVVAYSFQGDFGPVVWNTSARTVSAHAGAGFDLPRGWRVETTASHGIHRDHVYYSNAVDTAALNLALASSNLATAFNPFGDGGTANRALLSGLTRYQLTDNDSKLTAFALKADGEWFDLPAGPVRAAVGAERRRDRFEVVRITYSNAGVPGTPTTPPGGSRWTDAVYAELAVPLLPALDLSASVRREHSKDYGEAVTPKWGLRWALSRELALRGTWGKSFKAPRFEQTLASTGGSLLVMTAAQDPAADGGSTGVLFITGGNRTLTPEEAKTWTVGFDYAPAFVPGLKLESTYFDIDFVNRISTPGDLLTAVTQPAAYAKYLIRDPSQQVIDSYLAILDRLGGAQPADGIELIWDGRISNLAKLRVRGIDMTSAYEFRGSAGDFTLSASASHLLEFTRQGDPSSPPAALLDTLFNPIDWRVRGGVAWKRSSWSAGLNVNYLDDYRDVVSNPQRRIASWTTYDLRLARRWTLGFGGSKGLLEAGFHVQNLFNEDPPFVNASEGFAYDNRNTTPVGRVLSLELRGSW